MERVALVTGGTRGIGVAISSALKQDSYKVAATYFGNDEAAKNSALIQVYQLINGLFQIITLVLKV
jgi:NAD(P)-dependent dehydrogenase (short-subunit alcohol dehydrogenase family)